MKPKILFWQGRGKPKDVMLDFIELISDTHEVSFFPFTYDVGPEPFTYDSSWQKWLKENRFDWWCGISLGASLLYTMASLHQETMPRRITMINPFNSRSLLAYEKGFSMEGQWEINLSKYYFHANRFEMVISIFDEKIPMHHGIEVLNNTHAKLKRLIFVDDNHCIQNKVAQIELARLLLGGEYGGKNNRCHKYCHIYKQ